MRNHYRKALLGLKVDIFGNFKVYMRIFIDLDSNCIFHLSTGSKIDFCYSK
jgi:hypothetical protein